MAKLGIRDLVDKIITSQRINFDSRTLLMLHQHLDSYFDPHSGTMANFRRCMLKKLRAMGLVLPAQVIVRVPQLTSEEAPRLRALVTRYIRNLPDHPWIRQYYLSRLQFVKAQIPPLGLMLHNYQSALRHLTWDVLKHIVDQPVDQCACARLGQQIPRTGKHVLFRPSDLTGDSISLDAVHLSSENICALQQNMRGIPRLSPSDRWPQLRLELRQLCKHLGQRAVPPANLFSQAYGILKADGITEHGKYSDSVTSAPSFDKAIWMHLWPIG